MASKDNRRGNREVRKPKQAKAKPAAPTSPFVVTRAMPGGAATAKKK